MGDQLAGDARLHVPRYSRFDFLALCRNPVRRTDLFKDVRVIGDQDVRRFQNTWKSGSSAQA